MPHCEASQFVSLRLGVLATRFDVELELSWYLGGVPAQLRDEVWWYFPICYQGRLLEFVHAACAADNDEDCP